VSQRAARGAGSADVRVGTASWTDPEFIRAGWYPPEVKDDAEARLRYYADRFAMVEVNSTFYALPRIELVESWSKRTPDDFRFHVKAHGVISGHPVEPGRLPEPLRELPAQYDTRGRIRRPSRELRDAAIDALVEACGPLRGKLGAILLQLPPYVASGEAQRAEVARIVARLKPLRTAVEFRHRSWLADGERERILELLAEQDAALVVVDTPRLEVASALPTVVAATTDALAYLRFHGRNAGTWTTGRTVAERFDYVYAEEELRELLGPVGELADEVAEVAVVFNNNAADYALRNAARFRELLESSD
jgi:uncharacterized protein YecE (DUF72 family)